MMNPDTTNNKLKFDELRNLLECNRSIRRFDNARQISFEEIKEIVALARLCASGRNAQPLKYRIVIERNECREVYPLLAWAGYYKDWDGPEEAQRPVAYLVQCLDTEIAGNQLCDDGLQLEALTLGAAAKGIGCCIIKAFNAPALSRELGLGEHLQPLYVVAMGYPAETAKIVDLPADGDYKYFRNESDEQCVPKRPAEDIIIG